MSKLTMATRCKNLVSMIPFVAERTKFSLRSRGETTRLIKQVLPLFFGLSRRKKHVTKRFIAAPPPASVPSRPGFHQWQKTIGGRGSDGLFARIGRIDFRCMQRNQIARRTIAGPAVHRA